MGKLQEWELSQAGKLSPMHCMGVMRENFPASTHRPGEAQNTEAMTLAEFYLPRCGKRKTGETRVTWREAWKERKDHIRKGDQRALPSCI